MRPVSLRFPPELEDEFGRDLDRSARLPVRATLYAALATLLVWMPLQALLMPGTTGLASLAPQAGTAVVLLAGLWLNHRTVNPRLTRWIITGALLLIAIALLTAVSRFPDERRQHAFTSLFVFLTVNAAIPYRWTTKAAVGAVVSLGYPLLAANDPLHGPVALVQITASLNVVALFGLGIAWAMERYSRLRWYLIRQVAAERERSESLLLTILPAPIVGRLKSGDAAIVDAVPEATVLFADIVGFTRMAEAMSPRETMELLNHVFSRFDALARMLGIEKIKTIGDAYMCVAGLPEPRADHARAAAEMALEMREAVRKMRAMTGRDIAIRIGLNTGPVAAGIIGQHKFLYDLWGDTVNVASRMESYGVADEIQVTEATKAALVGRYELRERGVIEVKGKRDGIRTYLLTRPIVAAAAERKVANG